MADLSTGDSRKKMGDPLARIIGVYTMGDMTSAIDTYKAAKAQTRSVADACVATRKAHPELTMDQVVELSWHIETGKPEPKWLNEDGSQTAAGADWDRGFEKKYEE